LLKDIGVKTNSLESIMRYVSFEDIDIIYAHNFPLEFELGCDLKRKWDKPLIFEVHGLYPDLPGLRGFIRRRRMSKLFKSMPSYVDAFVAQTEQLARHIEMLGIYPPDKVAVVKNGVDLETFNSDNFSNSEMALTNFDKGDSIVLYSGFLDEVNGVDFLLKAIAKIRNELKNSIKFVVAGDGPFLNLVKKFEKENRDIFKYIGVVATDDMPLLYANCHLFVLPRPSHIGAETMTPLKLLEAMAMKCLVLSSDVGGIVEAMRPEREGIIYEKDNIQDCSIKLKKILNEKPSSFQYLRENAHKRVFQEYNWNRSKNILDKLYASLV
jgi:glycosyltransferase involved in cell wall biosynthesis